MGIEGHGTGGRFVRGITLLELMITVSIAAILLVVGIPSFKEFMARQRMKAAVGSLHNDLLMARSEAVHRNAVVVA